MHHSYNPAEEPRQLKAICRENVKLDDKFTVDFSFCNGTMLTQWSPDVPYGKKLRKIYPAYLKARDEFLLEVSAEIGGAVVVASPGGDVSVLGGSARG